MRPYSVELFSPQFEFKYHSLLDADEFSFSEDAISSEKNTVKLPRDFDPAGTDPENWYIRIVRNNEEYSGVITEFSRGETYNTVTYQDPVCLFSTNTLVGTLDITRGSIENYIKTLIAQEYINIDDPKQIIAGLQTPTTSGSTTGTLPFNETTEEKTSINLLDDLIIPAFDSYSIFTKVSIDFESKTLSVAIGKVSVSEPKTIEADLPNVIRPSFLFTQAKNINKADIYDIYPSPATKVSYYLHQDGTYDTNKNLSRLTPVKNKIQTLNGWSLAETMINEFLDRQIARFKEIAMLARDLTNDEYTELTAYASKFMPPYAAQHQLTAPNIQGSDSGSITIGATDYKKKKQNFEEYVNGGEWEDDVITDQSWLHSTYRNFNGHVLLQATVSATRTINGTVNNGSIDYQQPVTADNIQQSLASYKKTNRYEQEVQSAYESAVSSARSQRAAQMFAKNEYSNLIELSALESDTLIDPLSIKIGQPVDIIHQGSIYESMLTGRQISQGMVKLTFGKVRIELTKLLKGGLK